ncbi:Uridylate kinase [Alphaproteobacteria bacterium]
MGSQQFGLDTETISKICYDIKAVYGLGCQICIVIGGGNILRGATISSTGIERATADHMGMLATVINALALQSRLENIGLMTRVQSAIPMLTIAEQYIRRKAIRHMEKGRIVILSAGTGNPFFTTDTAAVLRAAETNCDVIFKGTQVDGVYSSDPKKNADAVKYQELSYKEVLTNDLNVMDAAAISLAKENNIPIVVFNISRASALMDVMQCKGEFSIIN